MDYGTGLKMQLEIGLLQGKTHKEQIPDIMAPDFREEKIKQLLADQVKRLEDCARLLQLRISQNNQIGNAKLKGILLCPEYYFSCNFRENNKTVEHLAFEENETFEFAKMMLKLTSKRFPNILIIPGTFVRIISCKKDPQGVSEFEKHDEQRRFQRLAGQLNNPYNIGQFMNQDDNDKTFNTVQDAKNEFLARKNKHATQMRKHTSSNKLTVLRNTALCFFNGEIVHTYHKHGNWNEAVGHNAIFAPGSKSPVFEVDRIRIGLEICRDHIAGVMLSSVTGKIRDGVLANEFIVRSEDQKANLKLASDQGIEKANKYVADKIASMDKVPPAELDSFRKKLNEKAKAIETNHTFQLQMKHHLALVDAQSARMGIKIARPDIHIIASDAIENLDVMMTHENGLFIHSSTSKSYCKVRVGDTDIPFDKNAITKIWFATADFIPDSSRASADNYQQIKQELISVCTRYLSNLDRIFKIRSKTSKTLASHIVNHVNSLSNVQFMKFCRFLDGTQPHYRDPDNGVYEYMSVKEGGELMSRLRNVLRNKSI